MMFVPSSGFGTSVATKGSIHPYAFVSTIAMQTGFIVIYLTAYSFGTIVFKAS